MVHNEKKTIEQDIRSYYNTIIEKIPDSELIIAEDGSRDSTRNVIYQLARKLPLVLLTTPHKRGYAKSLRLAFEKTKGELIFYADAGRKHNASDFWKLYKKINTFDLVSGYKKQRRDPWYRLLLAWGLNRSVNLYFRVSFRDIDSGFKLMTKKALHKVLERKWILRDNISLEIVLRVIYSGLKVAEVPITHLARRFGSSRGLPFKKIPRVITRLLLTYPSLKKNLLHLKK